MPRMLLLSFLNLSSMFVTSNSFDERRACRLKWLHKRLFAKTFWQDWFHSITAKECWTLFLNTKNNPMISSPKLDQHKFHHICPVHHPSSLPLPPPACTLPFCLGLQPCTTTLVVQWCWRPASSRRYRRLPMILLLSWPTASHESGVESQPQSWPEDSMMLKAHFAAALNWCWRPASQLADRTAEPIVNDQ